MELVILIVIFGLLFDYTNGFHDAANVVSTVIATRALAPLSAIVMAGVLNFIGATQISGVAQTIATGLVEIGSATQVVVLAAVFGAIVWNVITWAGGIPSSSSHALIGGLIGSAWMHAGIDQVLWTGVTYKVLLPMLLSPLLGFFLSFLLMLGLKVGLRHDTQAEKRKIFRHLQIGSACFVALAHGLNDAQKSMGIITLGLFAGGIITSTIIPTWVIFACAIVMALGTASGGFKIIRTLAYEITKIDPIQGFAAELSSSAVILSASFLGIPISSTHMIAGSITGVGFAQNREAVRWITAQKILIASLLTLPAAGLIGAMSYLLISLIPW